MKRVLLCCCAWLAGVLVWGQESKIVTETIHSEVLGADLHYNVYLPKGYDPAGEYPAVYLLHGLYGVYSDWQEKGHAQEIADELIASGELRPVVIIMPNAGDPDVHHVQNGYFNVEGWSYEDFFFQELLPQAEKAYHCGGSKGRRAIMGLSMGGGGSIAYAQRHPELFASSYGMSAWLDSQNRPDRENLDHSDKLYIVNKSVCDHSTLQFMDQASEETIGQLKGVQWFLDCGDDDGLMLLSVQLYVKMRRAGVPAQLRVRNGGHTWEYWRSALRMALPFASRNFD